MNKAEKSHADKVAGLGCIICGGPAEIHHLTGSGMALRASHYEVIPLCYPHHRGGGYGVAVHAGTKRWEEIHGTQESLLEKVRLIIGHPPLPTE